MADVLVQSFALPWPQRISGWSSASATLSAGFPEVLGSCAKRSVLYARIVLDEIVLRRYAMSSWYAYVLSACWLILVVHVAHRALQRCAVIPNQLVKCISEHVTVTASAQACHMRDRRFV